MCFLCFFFVFFLSLFSCLFLPVRCQRVVIVSVLLSSACRRRCRRSVPTVDELLQQYVLMPADVKDAYLIYILADFIDRRPDSAVIVFTQTCKYDDARRPATPRGCRRLHAAV